MNNTFNQFDQFEVPVSKNRCVFDFVQGSQNLVRTDIVTSGGTSTAKGNVAPFPHSFWYIRSKIYSDSASTTTTAKPIIFGKPINTNIYSEYSYSAFNATTQLTSTYPLGFDNSGQEQVPIIQEDALINLIDPTTTKVGFRAGYLEISFKTTKQNSILLYGSGLYEYNSANAIEKNYPTPTTVAVSGSNYSSDDEESVSKELSVNIKNGKLNLTYTDDYGTNKTYFEVNGNQTVADGVWHHVIVNFVRPGLVKDHVSKFTEKNIEFWIDGKLDKRTSEYINDQQIIFPEVQWAAANPSILFNDQFNYGTNKFKDSFNYNKDSYRANILSPNVYNGFWSDEAIATAFNGSIRTVATGTIIPLNQFEIQERFKFWNYDERPFRDSMESAVTMPVPAVSVNKKRALKLFWNDVDKKNGIELDNNYIINNYSVTHKNENSSTETYNVDLAKKKTLKTLTNVKVAVKDNVLIWGPGNVNPRNIKGATGIVQQDPNQISGTTGFVGSLNNLTFSGVELNSGDRILLTNQIDYSENGIWIFNGKSSSLTRPNTEDSPAKIANGLVYVEEGYEAQTYWVLDANVNSFTEKQTWKKLGEKPTETIHSQPILGNRWSSANGVARFIDLQNDVNIGQYDLIVFMNYPETFEEIKNSFNNDSTVKDKYDDFITSLRNVVAQGASLYVSSPLLAADLGVIKNYSLVDQKVEAIDAQSAAINPFEPSEASDQYFDTHRINQYHLATPVAGLTNKATYILTDFINYVPTDVNNQEQYHAKYTHRPLGILEGNEFYIPSLALRKITENENIPGERLNARGTKPLTVIKPGDILTGTVVTKLQNTYYNGTSTVSNPDDDDATTLIVHNSQLLKGQPVLGKIFVNFVEDGYTMSRKEYNKAFIQVLPTPDINETTTTRGWQYSTKRLNRVPQRTNISQLTELGQTTPTNGGGGPLIQAPTNSSDGIIRSETYSGNIDYQSDLYTTEAEEIYTLQEIPVLSMTYLGLLWLAE
jgi:hypothetical protein